MERCVAINLTFLNSISPVSENCNFLWYYRGFSGGPEKSFMLITENLVQMEACNKLEEKIISNAKILGNTNRRAPFSVILYLQLFPILIKKVFKCFPAIFPFSSTVLKLRFSVIFLHLFTDWHCRSPLSTSTLDIV